MSYFIGQNGRLGVAVNAEASGETFGGTPGDYEYFKLAPGGFKAEERCAKQYVEEVDVDPRDIITGGIYYTVTFECVMSYSYREHLFRLITGGAISTENTDPYEHTFANADKLLFGALALEYTDQAANANEIIKETFSNFCVTALTLSESPEGYVKMSVSGLATALTRVTNQASLSTVQNSEPVSWSHFTPSLNGTTTYHLGDINIELAQEVTEGEFDHAATTPATLDFVGRSGQRTLKWGFDIRMDSAAHTLLASQATVWDGANSFTWDNGGTTTAKRTLTITFGDSYQEGFPRTQVSWGRETASVSLMVKDGSTAFIAVVIENMRTTIA
jgi:hypothetical protein